MTNGHEAQRGQDDHEAHEYPAVASPNLETGFAHDYLERTGPEYLEAINPDTPESIQEYKDKLEALTRHLDCPQAILSVGVGAGEETLAVAELFKPMGATVYGLDISSTAVQKARARMAKYDLPAVIVEGSATDLPFEEESIDGFIFSAILHEIYSYLPDGKAAWRKAIEEVALKSTVGGKLLLRDFAAPSQQGVVTLTFLTERAADFYAYFAAYFRTFSTDGEDLKIKDRRQGGDGDFPLLRPSAGSVQLNYDRAAEVLLHFKNYCRDGDRGLNWLGDPNWKELNEVYLPPYPYLSETTTMSQDEYVRAVIKTANHVLRPRGYQYVCVENKTSTRPRVNQFLSRHFRLELAHSRMSSYKLIAGCTNKMELVFSKDLRA